MAIFHFEILVTCTEPDQIVLSQLSRTLSAASSANSGPSSNRRSSGILGDRFLARARFLR